MQNHRSSPLRPDRLSRRAVARAAEAGGRSGQGRRRDQVGVSRPRRPTGSPRLDQDETMKQCSPHHNLPPKAVAEAIQQREKATIEYPADGKLMGDWKKGERLAQSGYGLRFTDYPPRQRQRRQLLCLPPVDQGRSQLRHASGRACSTTARSAISARPTPRRRTRRSTMRRRPIRARTCRGSAPTRSSPSSRSRTWWRC